MGLGVVLDRKRPLDRREQIGDLIGERLAHLAGGDFFAEALLGERGRKLGRRRRAEVAGDEHFLQFLERRVVEPAAGEDGADAAGEAVRGPPQACLEPRKQAAPGPAFPRHQAGVPVRRSPATPLMRA